MKSSLNTKGILVLSCWVLAGGYLLRLHRKNIKARQKKSNFMKIFKRKVNTMETNNTNTTSKEEAITQNQAQEQVKEAQTTAQNIKEKIATGTNVVAAGVVIGKDAVVKTALKSKDVVVSGANTSWNWLKDQYSRMRIKPAQEENKDEQKCDTK